MFSKWSVRFKNGFAQAQDSQHRSSVIIWLLVFALILAGMVITWLCVERTDNDINALYTPAYYKTIDAFSGKQIIHDSAEMEPVAGMDDLYFYFKKGVPALRPDREINIVFQSAFYEPFNYVLEVVTSDGELLHAHLPNVRLVQTEGAEVLRYLKISDNEYYIELNCTELAFNALVTDEFFEELDHHQIMYIRQMLHDTAINLVADGEEESEDE